MHKILSGKITKAKRHGGEVQEAVSSNSSTAPPRKSSGYNLRGFNIKKTREV
jgi:hypothetical protein